MGSSEKQEGIGSAVAARFVCAPPRPPISQRTVIIIFHSQLHTCGFCWCLVKWDRHAPRFAWRMVAWCLTHLLGLPLILKSDLAPLRDKGRTAAAAYAAAGECGSRGGGDCRSRLRRMSGSRRGGEAPQPCQPSSHVHASAEQEVHTNGTRL